MKLFPRILKFAYYFMIVSAFCANMIVVSHTTALSVLGAGLALRGPDGSMMTATDGLYDERKSVFFIFGVGLACTVGSVVLCVWVILQWESALICMILTLATCRTIWTNYQRVQKRFDFDENDTVDFRDIMEGPAAIRGIPMIQSSILRAGVVGNAGGSGNSRGGGGGWYSRRKADAHWKKSSSLPVAPGDAFDTDESSDSGWKQGNQRMMDRNRRDQTRQDQTRQRRGRSNSPEDSFIQTV
jgi:hypothetical protein